MSGYLSPLRRTGKPQRWSDNPVRSLVFLTSGLAVVILLGAFFSGVAPPYLFFVFWITGPYLAIAMAAYFIRSSHAAQVPLLIATIAMGLFNVVVLEDDAWSWMAAPILQWPLSIIAIIMGGVMAFYSQRQLRATYKRQHIRGRSS